MGKDVLSRKSHAREENCKRESTSGCGNHGRISQSRQAAKAYRGNIRIHVNPRESCELKKTQSSKILPQAIQHTLVGGDSKSQKGRETHDVQ